MGQKVNPIIFRMGQIHHWTSRWFSQKNFQEFLKQDIQIKRFIKKYLKDAAVVQIEIERPGSTLTVIIYTAKPGMVIGRSGEGIEKLTKELKDRFLNDKTSIKITIQEVKNPNASSELILHGVIADLEKRIPFRRVMKQAIARAQKAGVKGVKVSCSGRLNGAEIARRETLNWGSLPLHTIRSDIDYARSTAFTTYGTIGVKVWIYKGEKFDKEDAHKNIQA